MDAGWMLLIGEKSISPFGTQTSKGQTAGKFACKLLFNIIFIGHPMSLRTEE
jgi:hypothetical protein